LIPATEYWIEGTFSLKKLLIRASCQDK
jgi:hypothetical protein